MRQVFIGTLLFFIFSLSLFLLVNNIEYQLWMSAKVRMTIFFVSSAFIFFLFVWFIGRPLVLIAKLKEGMSDEDAAREISKYFSDIKDTLLNALQLSLLSHSDNLLVQAAIAKKTEDLKPFSFTNAVDFSISKKYALILGAIILCLVLVSFVNPGIIVDSSQRIINFRREFSPKAPFSFQITNESLSGFKGEDFILSVSIKGNAIPDHVNIIVNEQLAHRLQKTSSDTYQYIFPNMQDPATFQLEAAGFYSDPYQIHINERPDLIAMDIEIVDPSYTKGGRRSVKNNGNLRVIEGSSVWWHIFSRATDSISFILNGQKIASQRAGGDRFQVNRQIMDAGSYEIHLYNEYGRNASTINYSIDVIKDERPVILVEYFPDTTFFRFITLAGNIADDYGFSSLKINYKKNGSELQSIPLALSKGVRKQSFYANWNIDSLDIKPRERLEFHVSVSDNDAVNGPKTTRSQTFLLEAPSAEEIKNIAKERSQLVEDQINESRKTADELNKRITEIEERLKTKRKIDWQEKKQLEKIINDREKLQKQIKELQKQHKALQATHDQYNKKSRQQAEQSKQFQDLLDKLLDEETQKLYERLKNLLKKDPSDPDQLRQELMNAQRNEKNLSRDLERALELFKRLKMESSLEGALKRLERLAKKQEEIAKDNTATIDKMEREQNEVKAEFEKFREEMDEVRAMNQELKRPQPIENSEVDERLISRELNEIEKALERPDNPDGEDTNKKSDTEGPQERMEDPPGKRPESGPSDDEGMRSKSSQRSQYGQVEKNAIRNKQNDAARQMGALQKKLANMRSAMQMETMQVNLDQLRDILDNLIKLSFNQEELMKEMSKVNQSDPRFLELAQKQLKLKDDSQVIQDSLLALAENVMQLSSFIGRETESINKNIDEALDYLKDRNRNRAIVSQKFAMTSINNLALLLDDAMQQMQMLMSEAMGHGGQSKQQQRNLQDLLKMQKQLGEQINELKGSGKQGRELSEELARLAVEQEMIRRQLEAIKKTEDGQSAGPSNSNDDLQRAIQMMEQNETDLVNKRLKQQLINRQKQIITRLLNAEKAQREQETDEEREATAPSFFSREIPPGFEEYLRLKQKEIELLKTIPVELLPFYKKEVNDYFRRISSDIENDR